MKNLDRTPQKNSAQNTLYLVLGLPGSGKSSFVKSFSGDLDVNIMLCGKFRPSTQHICFDSLRRALGHEYRAYAASLQSVASAADMLIHCYQDRKPWPNFEGQLESLRQALIAAGYGGKP